MISKLLKIVLALVAAVAQASVKAEDIDLFVGAAPSTTILPNVLIIVDNSANWTSVFDAEKAALVSVFNGLPLNKFRVGLMLFSETGSGNPSPGGAYVRAALRAMDATNRPLYASMVGGLSNSNPNADKGNGRNLSLSLVEAYRYYTAGAAYGGIKAKRDYPANVVTPESAYSASNAVYALAGNAFASSSSTTYVSPITDSCQRHFIIYVGNSTSGGNVAQDNISDNTDAGTILTAAGGDATQISISPVGASDSYANEWARFLKNSSLAISTYTVDVSLGSGGNAAANTALLKSIASEGGGKYFYVDGTASTVGSDIEKALGAILSEIQSVNSVFASVSLPVSVNTQGNYLNQVFVGMFRPDIDSAPRWTGNLKQYKLGRVSGSVRLLDSADSSAINNQTGFITECARSYWTPSATDSYWAFKSWPAGTTFCIPPSGSSASLYKNSNSPDGNIVEKGAQAYQLRVGTSRTVKTCATSMTACSSLIAFDNSNVTEGMLGVSTTTERDSLINWAKGLDVSDEDVDAVTTAEMRPSSHSDVVHSRPVAVNFGTDAAAQVIVFYGSNDGMFRAVNGNRTAAIGSIPAGGELWSFMAPEFLTKIKRLKDNTPPVFYPTVSYGEAATPLRKAYGMDGPITAFSGTIGGAQKNFIYATMRRGGRSVYAFDVTNSLTAPSSPTLKWRLGCADSTDADCRSGFSGIGQTWSSLKSFTASGHDAGATPLLIFGGGYDGCEDYDALSSGGANSNCTATSKGHYVYVVEADSGTLVATFDTGGTRGVIADVTLVRDAAGHVIYGYTADLGGNVYRIAFGSGAAASWTITKIASLGCSSTSTCTANRKFMFAPSVIALGNDVYGIMIGSGDREKPLTYYAAASAVSNYFFMFYDKPMVSASTWPGTGDCGTAVICLNSLLGITTSATPTDADLAAKKGWYLGLASTEQVVTSAVTIFGVVTFSTHQPAVPTPGTCSSNLGSTRVYNIAYTNAGSANGTGSRFEDVAGDGLPPSPVAGQVKLDDGTTVPFCIGCNKDSPLEGSPPLGLTTVVQPKGRLYWYIQK